MGGLAALSQKAVYLDTNILVYAVEGFDEHRGFIEDLFGRIDAGEVSAVTSELSLAEALVKPLEMRRDDIVELYLVLLQSSERFSVLAIDRGILIQAARYRAQLGIKLPDAIHVATAVAGNCDTFVTNDQRIRLPAGLALQTLG
jgi:predicted nucleic acid-binding protein